MILESDRLLRDAVTHQLGDGTVCKTSSVLREKGLEFPWVVWSTRISCPEGVEIRKLCYTILSRCTQQIVIWIQPFGCVGSKNQRHLSLLFGVGHGRLRPDRLLVLDALTEQCIRRLAIV